MMRVHTQGLCIKPDYWEVRPPGSYFTDYEGRDQNIVKVQQTRLAAVIRLIASLTTFFLMLIKFLCGDGLVKMEIELD